MTIKPEDEAALQVQRHRAEVTTLIRMRRERGADWLSAWLADPRVAGRAPALKADIKAQWELGNKGKGWV